MQIVVANDVKYSEPYSISLTQERPQLVPENVKLASFTSFQAFPLDFKPCHPLNKTLLSCVLLFLILLGLETRAERNQKRGYVVILH